MAFTKAASVVLALSGLTLVGGLALADQHEAGSDYCPGLTSKKTQKTKDIDAEIRNYEAEKRKISTEEAKIADQRAVIDTADKEHRRANDVAESNYKSSVTLAEKDLKKAMDTAEREYHKASELAESTRKSATDLSDANQKKSVDTAESLIDDAKDRIAASTKVQVQSDRSIAQYKRDITDINRESNVANCQ